jgi:predicted N-acetyltransferase YhbS
MKIEYRELTKNDLDGLRGIDRSDFNPSMYCMEDGELILQNWEFKHPGFTQAQWENTIRKFSRELEKGHTHLFGAFDGSALVGISGLEVDRLVGPAKDMLNMGPMWINAAHRRRGIGRKLLAMATQKAGDLGLGARSLYVSACPVRGTVEFYLQEGCRMLAEPDAELFADEPEDIHMELDL